MVTGPSCCGCAAAEGASARCRPWRCRLRHRQTAASAAVEALPHLGRAGKQMPPRLHHSLQRRQSLQQCQSLMQRLALRQQQRQWCRSLQQPCHESGTGSAPNRALQAPRRRTTQTPLPHLPLAIR